MYDFDFDSGTNGLELPWRDTGGEISRREPRPVYAGGDGVARLWENV